MQGLRASSWMAKVGPGVDTLEIVLSVCLGIGLAAACGFRVFLPPLALGIAVRLGLPVTEVAPEWMGSWVAIAAFGGASLIEIVAYYVPWLDNALDTVASPLAVIAGILLTAGVTGELHPAAQWTLAIVAGGGAAAVTQTATVMTRALSSATTGGLANSLVSTLEVVAAVVFAFLALVIAPLAVALFLLAIYWLWQTIKKRRARRAPAMA
jgi:hypothetical protein